MIINRRQAIDATRDFKKTINVVKVPSQITTTGIWFDLNLSPGNPKPFYYAAPPGEAAALTVLDGGIQHGGNVSPKQKYLRRNLMQTNSATGLPMSMRLVDYVMYYPFIDMGETDNQPMINDVILPRYVTGEGLQVMAVLVAAGVGGQTFRFTYTNQNGVGGRISNTVIMNTATVNGTIINSQNANAAANGPFIGLQSGDTGVRSIESVQMISGPDVGLFTLVLVKPIANIQILERTAPVEVDYLRDFGFMPRIEDGAYLNYICLPNGSLSGVRLNNELDFIWG
jgi:hypothetical protein